MLLGIDRRPKKALAILDSYGERLLYGDLVAFSNKIKTVIPPRSLLFILCKNNIGGVAWTIASIEAGVVPLLLSVQIDDQFFDNLYSLYHPTYLCLPTEQVSRLKKHNYETLCDSFGYSLLFTREISYPIYCDLSHLLPTSGSTGSPKLVRHCYSNIEAAGLNISTLFEITPEDRTLMVLPLYYTMGLSIVFSHLHAGATILITDLSMTDPKFWAFIRDERATSFTGVPYSFEILRLMRFFRMELPHLKTLTQGGGKMEKRLNLQFAEHCRDHNMKWIATYGQTEGTARMAYLPHEYAISKVGSIGRAVPNGELYLIDDSGNIIEAPNTEGEMCYRGKNVTLGYARCKEELLLGDERGGSIQTGDLAYRDEDGCYYIVGRKGRFLKLFGLRIGLDECEQIIKSKFSTECACIGTDERMTIFVTTEGIEQAVKEEISNKLKLVASAFNIIKIEALPKSEAGKILYSKLVNY